MAADMTSLSDHYSTHSIMHLLEDFAGPSTTFDAHGRWTADYHICMTVGRVRNRVGRVTLARTPNKGGGMSISVSHTRRLTADFSQAIEARFTCEDDMLSRPTQWEYHSALFSPEGEPVAHSSLRKSAHARKSEIVFADQEGRKHRTPVSGDYTCSWTLFDAVQRFPSTANTPVPFLLIDHCDELRPNQTLSKREPATISLPAGPVRVNIYQQLGEGVLPIEYWVAESGQLLWVVSGLEAYILDA